MVFKRPYAFLIKHFRLIHILLFILLAYITYKANNILSFFLDYISNNGLINIDASMYVGPLVYITIFLIIVISVIIFFLMRYKNKPKLFYIILIVISIISGMLFTYLFNNINVLETSVLSAKTIRLYRDISRFNYYILFITCIPVLIRGLGFDIKKFNFSNDLKQLEIEEQDSEEVEVNIDLSSDGIKRTSRKIGRELKYYYYDNKFIINIILGVVGVILIINIFNNIVVNGKLKEGDTLSTSYFNISVIDSYITDRKRISKNNSYVILKVNLKGKSSKYSLDLDEFVLEGENNNYIPSLKYYYYFTDIGVGYKNNVLDTSQYKEYILVYNIMNEDVDGKFMLNYLGNDRKIKLNPEVIE